MTQCNITTMTDKYADFLKENDIIIFPMFSDKLNEGVLALGVV